MRTSTLIIPCLRYAAPLAKLTVATEIAWPDKWPRRITAGGQCATVCPRNQSKRFKRTTAGADAMEALTLSVEEIVELLGELDGFVPADADEHLQHPADGRHAGLVLEEEFALLGKVVGD